MNDGLNVKFTKDYSETICYLVIMTRSLIKKYRGKVLFSCAREDLCGKSDNYLMTYGDFESGSRKMTTYTASEIFLKHLLQFSGMSVNHARAITQHFPTLSSLLHAYHSCTLLGKTGLNQRINLIALIKSHSTDRTIGPALGKKLMTTYCRNIPQIPPKISKNPAKISKNPAKVTENSAKVTENSAKITEHSAN